MQRPRKFDTTHVRKALSGVEFLPFWLASVPPAPQEPALTEATECDLLIVGGGFTGLWAALQAKEASPGKDIVLVDENRICHGASGRPGGIISTSIMHGLGNAQRLYPKELSALELLGIENLEGFTASLESYGIEAEVEWGGELTVAIGDEAVDDVRAEFAAHRAHGHRVSFLDKAELQSEIASPLFSAGCWNRDRSGTLHPARLAYGLLKACKGLGVRVFENTAVNEIERLSGMLRVKTRAGEITTGKVLLATNAYARGHRKIKSRVAGVYDRIIMSEPLNAEQFAAVGWKNRQGVYDSRTQLNYMRLTRDNRILFGGRLAYFFGGARSSDPALDGTPQPYIKLARAFFRTFPQLEDVKFSHAWSGPIALTTRMAVHFQSYFDGDVVWAGGYSGFGVSASRFGARLGLAKLDREPTPELELAFARAMPRRIPPEPLRWLGAQITLHALDTADEKGGWRRPWLRMVEKMGFPLT